MLKKLLPYLYSLLGLLVIWLIYIGPVVFSDKALKAEDAVQFESMIKQNREYTAEFDEPAYWNVGLFGGMPNYVLGVQPNSGLGRYVQDVFSGFTHKAPADRVFHLFIGTWIMLLCFGLRPLLAFLGTLCFSFTSYNIVLLQAGHNTKLSAIGLGCMIVGGLYLILTQRRLLGFAVLALGTFMNLVSFHVQISFYLALGLIPLYLFYTIQKAKKQHWKSIGKDFAVIALAVTLGVGSVIGRYLITKEYSEYSIRGLKELTPLDQSGLEAGKSGLNRDYAFSWSQGVYESLTLLIPDLYGSSSAEKPVKNGEFVKALEKVAGKQQAARLADQKLAPYYFGDQPFTSGPIYAGAVLIFLCVLCLIPFREYRTWIIAGIVITLILSWGRNFSAVNYFLFDHFPLFNKFRSVSMAQSITVMLISLGAFLLLKALWQQEKVDIDFKKVSIAFYVLGGICLIHMLFPGMLDLSSPKDAAFVQRFGIPEQNIGTFVRAIEEDRASMIRSSAFRSFLFIGLAFGTLFLVEKNKLKLQTGVLIIAVLALIDVALISFRFVKPSDFKVEKRSMVVRPSEADKRILNDPQNARVINLAGNIFNEATTAYFHKDVGGYSPAKLQRYQDLIERRITPELTTATNQLRQGRTDLEGTPVLNMLNTRYLKFGDAANQVAINKNAAGNAWFVNSVIPVGSADQEIETLGRIDTKTTAVVDTSKFSVSSTQFSVDPGATAKLVTYNNNNIELELTNPNNGFLVLSEIYYPVGWTASLNDQPVEIKRTNYVLRGLEVPAGKHTLKLSFYPESFQRYQGIQYASMTILLLLCIAAFAIAFKRAENGKPTDPALLAD